MQERAERIVAAVLNDIRRAVKLARLHGREPREAQPVEPSAQAREVLPALRPTQFDCRIEVPIARPERADGTEAGLKAPLPAFETIELCGEFDASGALLIHRMEVESRASS